MVVVVREGQAVTICDVCSREMSRSSEIIGEVDPTSPDICGDQCLAVYGAENEGY